MRLFMKLQPYAARLKNCRTTSDTCLGRPYPRGLTSGAAPSRAERVSRQMVTAMVQRAADRGEAAVAIAARAVN